MRGKGALVGGLGLLLYVLLFWWYFEGIFSSGAFVVGG